MHIHRTTSQWRLWNPSPKKKKKKLRSTTSTALIPKCNTLLHIIDTLCIHHYSPTWLTLCYIVDNYTCILCYIFRQINKSNLWLYFNNFFFEKLLYFKCFIFKTWCVLYLIYSIIRMISLPTVIKIHGKFSSVLTLYETCKYKLWMKKQHMNTE